MLCTLFISSTPVQAENLGNQNFECFDSCPTARFTVVNNGVDAGIPVHFTNESSGATSYLWDFGDGNTSTAVNPVHTYNAAGTYTVKLYASIDGCTVEWIGTEDVIQG